MMTKPNNTHPIKNHLSEIFDHFLTIRGVVGLMGGVWGVGTDGWEITDGVGLIDWGVGGVGRVGFDTVMGACVGGVCIVVMVGIAMGGWTSLGSERLFCIGHCRGVGEDRGCEGVTATDGEIWGWVMGLFISVGAITGFMFCWDVVLTVCGIPIGGAITGGIGINSWGWADCRTGVLTTGSGVTILSCGDACKGVDRFGWEVVSVTHTIVLSDNSLYSFSLKISHSVLFWDGVIGFVTADWGLFIHVFGLVVWFGIVWSAMCGGIEI